MKANKNSNNEKEKKPVTLKSLIIKRIIFILVFLLISAGITAYFIIVDPFSKNNLSSTTSKKTDTLDNEIEKTPARNHVSLLNYETDKFDYNDLKISRINETYEGYDIAYFKIDGLLNTTIQDKINNNLKNDLEKAITDAVNTGNIKGEFYVWSFDSSSFANTLSIIYELSSYIIDDKTGEFLYYWTSSIPENYDLNTGNKLQIQDLFTDDTLGSDIFDNSFYKEIVMRYTSQEINEETWQYRITDYKDIDEEILNIIMDFNNGKEIPFYFDEQTVTLANNYIFSRVFFDENLEFLALYNNFKSPKSLFTGEYPALHNLPVLTKRYPSYYQTIEEGENYYIDITLSGSYDDSNEETICRLLDCTKIQIEDDIEKMKQEAKESNKFVIFNYSYELDSYYNLNDNEENNVYTINTAKAKMETTKSLFKSEIKKEIENIFRTAERINSGEARLYNNLFCYYMYDEYSENWNINHDDTLYIDKAGNIFDNYNDADSSIIWGTED